MISAELKQKAIDDLTHFVEVANRVYSQAFDVPKIIWDVRGTRAGYVKANATEWVLHLNPILLSENPDEIRDTVGHEFAHLVDAKVYPETRERGVVWTRRGPRREKRSVHGPTWKSIMTQFGLSPTRCHNMDTANARVKPRRRYSYECPTCGHIGEIGPKHHKLVQQGYLGIYFKKCGNTHKLTKESFRSGTTSAPVKRVPAPQMVPATPQMFAPIPNNKPVTIHFLNAQPPAPKKTKLDRVIGMMKTYPSNISRAEFVRMIMQNVGMSKAGAETYYYNAKKAIEAGR